MHPAFVVPVSPVLQLGAVPPLIAHLAKGSDPWTATPEQADALGFDAAEFAAIFAGRPGPASIRIDAPHGVSAEIEFLPSLDPLVRVLRLHLRNQTDRVIAAVDFPRLGPLRHVPGSVLVVPDGSGWALDDPVPATAVNPLTIAYPAPASMPWLDYHTREEGIVLLVDDPAAEHKVFSFGGPEELLFVRFFPFLPPGGAWTSPPVIVARHPGDWHAAADLYRARSEGWARPPHPPPASPVPTGDRGPRTEDSAADRPRVWGWTSLTLRDPKGGPAAPDGYAAIPKRLGETMPYGIDAVHLLGWFQDGGDDGAPDYRPIDDLGGWEALRAAVGEGHAMGGRVFLYFNGRLADLQSATRAKATGPWDVIGPDGAPVVETYGGRRFAVLCPSVRAWRERLVGGVARAARETGADGAFIDPVAAAPSLLCYNPAHGHATPASAFGPGALAMLREIRDAVRAVRPDFFVGVDGTQDAYGPFVNARQTGGVNARRRLDFPAGRPLRELSRYAMPAARQVCAGVGPTDAGGEPFAEGFLLGKALIGSGPEVGRYTEMYKRAPGCFYDGRLLAESPVVSDPTVRGALLAGAEGTVVTLWNTGTAARDVEVACKADAGWAGRMGLPPSGGGKAALLEVVDLGETALPRVESRRTGGGIAFHAKLGAGEARGYLVRKAR